LTIYRFLRPLNNKFFETVFKSSMLSNCWIIDSRFTNSIYQYYNINSLKIKEGKYGRIDSNKSSSGNYSDNTLEDLRGANLRNQNLEGLNLESADLDNATSANPELTGSSTTILTVTGTDENGCVNSDQVEIVVNPLPQALIDVVSDVCFGAPTFFSESSIGNGLTYAWTVGENTSNTNSSFSHTYGSPNTFPVTLDVTDVNGCQGSDATTAVVSPLPVVTMTIANGPDFCE
jgi:hypothetical protein